MKAIVLHGTVGSGKTTILREIGAVLDERGDPYGIVDLDWLAWMRPAPDAEVTVADALVENLRAVVRTFRRAGVRHVVLARCLQTAAEVDAVTASLGDADVTVVCLTAPTAVIERRLRSRDSGRELDEHLELLHSFKDAEIGDRIVNSDTRTARAVAVEVLQRAGWSNGNEFLH